MAPTIPRGVMTASVVERLKKPAIATAALLVLFGLVHGRIGHPDPDQGLSTTCRNFLEMSSAEQEAVMNKAGVVPALVEARIAYFRAGCAAHPKSLDRALSASW